MNARSRADTIIDVRVIPRAPRSRIDGLRAGALLVRLAAPPVEGAANDALIALLAERLGCPRRQLAIVAGEKSRDKRVRIDGFTVEEAMARLLAGAS
jgi:uncharacterized protein (TIGR00251 family)